MPSSARSANIGSRWQQAFMAAVQTHENAGPLREASLAGQLKTWTRLLTAVVVQSCHSLGWCAAAKGFSLNLLPQVGQEYLGMDIMAFAKPEQEGVACWSFPIAVFELENSRDDDRVAYSLWKVLCLRSRLRVVFCYRRGWEEARQLILALSTNVVARIPIEQRADLAGQTLIVVGSRGERETFPWGYFKTWELAASLGRFEKI
jgi:hypothetical protein